MQLTEIQRAWLAGFIDGEGYLGIIFQRKKETKRQSASPRYHPYLVVVSTNRMILRHVMDLVPDGNVYLLKKESEKWKAAYQFKLTKMKPLLTLLKQLEPHLQLKKPQCRVLIEFLARRLLVKPVVGRGSRGITSFTDRDWGSHQELLTLNKRGPTHHVAA